MTHMYDIHAGGKEVHAANDFTWPGNKKIGIVFRMAYEWWSDGNWPGIGPMGNPLKGGIPDLNAIGWAEYGHRRGVHRVLEVFERHHIKASILVCGIMAERYPSEVKAIADLGHDIVAHSYAMDVIPAYLDESQELDNIRRTTDLIAQVIGTRPKGWISPRSTPSPRTARLLAKEGYQWHSDTLNDDLPYRVDFEDCSIVAVPGTMEVNDLPLFMRHGQPPRVMVEIFEDWLNYVRKWETRAIKIAADDVWIGTRSEMVEHFLNSLKE